LTLNSVIYWSIAYDFEREMGLLIHCMMSLCLCRLDVDVPTASKTILDELLLTEALLDTVTSDGSSMFSMFTTRRLFIGTVKCFAFRCQIRLLVSPLLQVIVR